jgi:hypothetical protein
VVGIGLGDHDRARLAVVRRAVVLLAQQKPVEEGRQALVDAVAVQAVEDEDVDERGGRVVGRRLSEGGGRDQRGQGEAEREQAKSEHPC